MAFSSLCLLPPQTSTVLSLGDTFIILEEFLEPLREAGGGKLELRSSIGKKKLLLNGIQICVSGEGNVVLS